MNRDRFNTLRLNLSGLSFWLVMLALVSLLGAAGLGWILRSLAVLFLLLLLAPTVAILVFRWWLGRNLVQGECPACTYQFSAFRSADFCCPNCGEPLQVGNEGFERVSPPGTIDVEVVDVSRLDEGS